MSDLMLYRIAGCYILLCIVLFCEWVKNRKPKIAESDIDW